MCEMVVSILLFRILTISLLWWGAVCVTPAWMDRMRDYDEVQLRDTIKPVCSELYERCEHWDCCRSYECGIARKGDESRQAFLFFCQDPTKNETENMLGLNDFVFWNPDVFGD